MRTGKQTRSINLLLPFTQCSEVSDAAVAAFFKVTGQGLSSWEVVKSLDKAQVIEFQELLVAHDITSHSYSYLLEGQWLDGMEDYPLGMIIWDLELGPEAHRVGPVAVRAWILARKVYPEWYVKALREQIDYELAEYNSTEVP